MAKGSHKKSGALPLIARHPLFPVAVALWFGALFGLSSLAIAPSLVEKVFALTGIDKLFAFAAPPLGSTTRIQLALAMAGVGGILGSMLSRRFAQSKAVAHPRRRKTGTPEHDAGDEYDAPLDAEAKVIELGAPAPAARRRNPLAPAPVDPKYPVYSYGAPAAPFSADDGGPLDDSEPLDDDDASDESAPVHAEDALVPEETDTEAGEEIVLEIEDEEPQESGLPRLFSDTSDAQDVVCEPPQTAPAAGNAPRPHLFTRPHSAQVPTVGWGLEMAGSAPAATTATEPEEAAEPETEELDASDAQVSEHATHDGPANETQPVENAVAGNEGTCSGGTAERRIAAADLDDLSHLELLERLAISIDRKRRDALATPSAMTEVTDARPIAFETNLPPLPPVPAALRPVNLEPDDEEEGSAEFAPPRHIAMQQDRRAAESTSTGGSDTGNDSPESGDKADQEYSSLIGLQRPRPAPSAPAGLAGHDAHDRGSFSSGPANQADSGDHAGLLRSNLAALRKMAGGE